MFRVVLITVFLHFVAPQKCPPGTYLYTNLIISTGEHFCIECQDGTFMPNKDHRQTSCRPCENIRDLELEILISPCNKTHDAVIHCVDGYYRDQARNPRETGQCRKCTECPKFTGQPCSTYRDTVCCWDENFEVVPNHHGVPRCRERPWFCRQGQYFDTRGYQCLPCPDNTYMPIDYHIQPECWKCREYDKYESYRPLHSVIIQPCNSTHAPVIRCEDGFFMNPKMSYRGDALGCSPCTDCSTTDVQYEGRKCDGMEDTVCCPQPNMTVVDTPDGPVCCPKPNMTVVDTPDGPVCSALSDDCEGCQHYHVRKRSTRCAPCTSSGVIDVTDFTGKSTELEHAAEKVLSVGDTKNATRPAIQTENLIIGLAIGVVATLVLLIMLLIFYMKYLRHRAVFKMLEAKIIRLYFENSMTVQHGARSLDDKDDEARQPLRKKKLSSIENPQMEARQPLTQDTSSSFENHQTSFTLPDDGEVEMTSGHDDDLHERKEKCKKSSNHTKFTIQNFTTSNLPRNDHHLAQSEHINAICDLTVRIRVQHVSSDRPDYDPYHKFAGLQGAGLNRCGSGLVFQMSKEFGVGNQRCPCHNCQADPSNSRKRRAEFLVVTSTQLVFDDTECRKASCILWFNEDSDDMSPAPSLRGRNMKILKDKDVCIMHCVTHFKNVSEKLKNIVNHFNTLRQRYRTPSSGQADDQFAKAVVVSHPHGLSKRISIGKATAKMDGQTQKWTIDAQTCPGSLGAPVCLTGDTQNATICTGIYTGGNECTGFNLDLSHEI